MGSVLFMTRSEWISREHEALSVTDNARRRRTHAGSIASVLSDKGVDARPAFRLMSIEQVAICASRR
jgi:hypothetical protein